MWMVEAMLDLVKEESEHIDSRFLEPACGSGNFLVRVLQRKLAAVELKFGKSEFERKQYALLGLMCTYGDTEASPEVGIFLGHAIHCRHQAKCHRLSPRRTDFWKADTSSHFRSLANARLLEGGS